MKNNLKFGIGSWQTFTENSNVSEISEMLSFAIDEGINFVDTADSYAEGYAEKVIGKILGQFPRESYLISTKCYFPTQTSPKGGLNSKHIYDAYHRSQERLKVDFFDIYFAHRYDPLVPTQEVAHIFNCLINENKIKKWGICRWPLEKAIEIINFCHKNDLHPPSSQQFHYNLFNREAETESFPLFYSHNLPTVSYSPLAQGVLTGKYFLGTGKSTRAALISARKTMWDMQDEKILNVEAWRAVLEKFDLAPSAAAISFCLNRKEISRVLLGARNKTQLIENIKASNLPWQKIYEESFHGM